MHILFLVQGTNKLSSRPHTALSALSNGGWPGLRLRPPSTAAKSRYKAFTAYTPLEPPTSTHVSLFDTGAQGLNLARPSAGQSTAGESCVRKGGFAVSVAPAYANARARHERDGRDPVLFRTQLVCRFGPVAAEKEKLRGSKRCNDKQTEIETFISTP